jgi:hypothetical protein
MALVNMPKNPPPPTCSKCRPRGSAKLSVADDYQNEAAIIDYAPFFCRLRGNSSATYACFTAESRHRSAALPIAMALVGQFDCGEVPGWKRPDSGRIFGGVLKHMRGPCPRLTI